jgi:hypothetical protein
MASFLALSLLMLAMLNPPAGRGDLSLVMPYLSGSHLILTIWAGYGLVFLGTLMARGKELQPR